MEQTEYQEYIEAFRKMNRHMAKIQNLLSVLHPLAMVYRRETLCGVKLDGYQIAFDALKSMASDIATMEAATRQTLEHWIERVTDEAERNR